MQMLIMKHAFWQGTTQIKGQNKDVKNERKRNIANSGKFRQDVHHKLNVCDLS